jgi:hypothetical protein
LVTRIQGRTQAEDECQWDVEKILGHERDKVTGDWRKLHNDGLRALHPSPDSIRLMEPVNMRWAVHVARMGEKRNAYRILVGKPDEKRLL